MYFTALWARLMANSSCEIFCERENGQVIWNTIKYTLVDCV